MDSNARSGDDRTPLEAQRADTGALASTVYARLAARGNSAQRYRLGEEIGHGGMGRVFAAHDEDLHREVALKVIREAPRDDGAAPGGISPHSLRLARFLEEAQVTGQLDHPGIVPVHELGIDARGRVYFAMKRVRGMDLSEVLKRAREDGEWNPTRVVGVLLRVCEAMAYAHSKHVIHRDLKPSNIRIGRFGAVYVMDWGLARVMGADDARDLRVREPDPAATSHAVRSERHGDSPAAALLHTMDGTPIGTPAFMSPEQALGRADLMGPATDVYGVGAILYTLLTGQAPYVSPITQVDVLALLRWIKEGPPTPVALLAPKATPELVAICEKAMQRDPAQRYADMGELAEDLRAYLETRVVRAYRGGPWREFVLWVRRNRVVAALAAALLLVATLSGFGLAWQRRLAALESQRGADAHEAAALMQELDALAPIAPDTLPKLEDWFARTNRVLQRRDQWQLDRDELLKRARARGRVSERELAPEQAATYRLRNARADRERYARELASPQPLTGPGVDDRVIEAHLQRTQSILPIVLEHLDEQIAAAQALERPRMRAAFVDAAEQRSYDALADVLERLEELANRGVREAERLRKLMRWSHGPSQDEWERAWRELANTRVQSDDWRALYGALELEPRRDLLPLGRNTLSGLWEFWHIPSGARPTPAEGGGWAIGADTAMVLVLLPGASALIGASSDPSAVRHDPLANKTEYLSRARLDPFLLSKYELTQGQLLRLWGANPSEFAAGAHYFLDPRIGYSHPATSFSHEQCVALLARLELTLPTEMQFEYAARAGSERALPAGDETRLHLYANHFDATAMRSQGQAPGAAPDDGRVLPAAVGSYAPNAFGLHDMLGNVAEWCLDWYVGSDKEVIVQDGAGERVPVRATERVVRGGDFQTLPPYLRHSYRAHAAPDAKSASTGVRPVLLLFPTEDV